MIVVGISNSDDDENGDKKRDAAGAGWEQDVGNRTTHRVINQHLIKACLDETDCGIFGAAEQLIFAGAYLVIGTAVLFAVFFFASSPRRRDIA